MPYAEGMFYVVMFYGQSSQTMGNETEFLQGDSFFNLGGGRWMGKPL